MARIWAMAPSVGGAKTAATGPRITARETVKRNEATGGNIAA